MFTCSICLCLYRFQEWHRCNQHQSGMWGIFSATLLNVDLTDCQWLTRNLLLLNLHTYDFTITSGNEGRMKEIIWLHHIVWIDLAVSAIHIRRFSRGPFLTKMNLHTASASSRRRDRSWRTKISQGISLSCEVHNHRWSLSPFPQLLLRSPHPSAAEVESRFYDPYLLFHCHCTANWRDFQVLNLTSRGSWTWYVNRSEGPQGATFIQRFTKRGALGSSGLVWGWDVRYLIKCHRTCLLLLLFPLPPLPRPQPQRASHR